MSAGKAAAQTAHAVSLLGNFNQTFIEKPRRTVIVLEAENENQMKNLEEYLFDAGLASFLYTDEGANEVPAYSVTAMAVEPFDEEDKELREIFKPFQLFYADSNEMALEGLRGVARSYRNYSDWTDHTPRVLNKAIKFLEKRK